ncbi:uncharacterized protein LACBIDRAFT_313537 [Laccaria bicolor S238N-H82]|uniref:Predicted protein n=1 Tax=Laccaria bicolor (strain S238N-H82 / ATCC MYA-4686) TaxID=486041 RepID=B0D079_LACBS|nr:uncharacterized protein LACBIDRAFT_313537 [Laccaria bicolor S238N-H82]EDR11783.1 predicted protein [Laccaria bicolor S238N-H82]|eukprot:XP_001877680.1 predicted protein [Laccaria bicolor S238N-H82]
MSFPTSSDDLLKQLADRADLQHTPAEGFNNKGTASSIDAHASLPVASSSSNAGGNLTPRGINNP